MSSRSSSKDTDGYTWTTVPLILGEQGLDLRRPDQPQTLSELLNARFSDARTIERRGGHDGSLLQDKSDFVANAVVSDEYVYGHGRKITVPGDLTETYHYPIYPVGRGVFEYDDSTVVWTGDRLLVRHTDHRWLGASKAWSEDGDVSLNYGIPAYIPVQTERLVPAGLVNGELLDGCLTETLEIHVGIGATAILLETTDRFTHTIIRSDELATSGNTIALRCINSGGHPLVFWLDDGGLHVSHYTGSGWATPITIDDDAEAFNLAQVPSGCQLIWRTAAELFTGRFSGNHVTSAPHPFGTSLFCGPPSGDPDGKVAVAVSPNNDIAWGWVSDNKVYVLSYSGSLAQFDGPETEWDDDYISPIGGWDGDHLTISYRTLRDENGLYNFVVHMSRNAGALPARVVELTQTSMVTSGSAEVANRLMYRCWLQSTSFVMGNEVFAWMYARNSRTNYLIAGVATPLVCAIADREEAALYTYNSFTPVDDCFNVYKDPLSPSRFTWARSVQQDEFFARGFGRIGTIEMLPQFSSARYGLSQYVAGSMVRCWDGREFGDAGFHDYTVIGLEEDTGGVLAAGTYAIAIHPVRYNNRGERFMGVATVARIALTGTNKAINVKWKTTPLTNHDDVVWEIYATYTDGTSYRLIDTVANDLTVDQLEVTYSMAVGTWDARPADPHAPATDGTQEIEESAPYGCAIIAASGDRLWGIGGQVGPGTIQFSKKWEAGEGAGFDALAGYAVMDASNVELTSIVGFADTAMVALARDRLYVLNGSGPDNFRRGEFAIPELTMTDGAITHFGTLALPMGIVYWSNGGPRVFNSKFETVNLSEKVAALASTMTPTGVTVDLAVNEVVWFTADGRALLLNFLGEARWARWDNLPVAAVGTHQLISPDGTLLTPSSTPRDAGRRFTFKFATGNVRLENMLQGGVEVRKIGMVGKYNGPHQPYFYLYYDGSPLWSERVRWDPQDKTWFATGSSVATLTPAEIDKLDALDKSGGYSTAFRASRENCSHIRVLVSDCGDSGFTPWELTFELGARTGFGRVPVNTMKR